MLLSLSHNFSIAEINFAPFSAIKLAYGDFKMILAALVKILTH